MTKTGSEKRFRWDIIAAVVILGILPAGCSSSLNSGRPAPGASPATEGTMSGNLGPGADDAGGIGDDALVQSGEAEDVTFLTELEGPTAQEEEGGIHVDKNDRVEYFVKIFTDPEKPWVRRSLARSGRYIDRMKEIFKEEGLPEDLVYLALIESGFNPYAFSRSGAVGIWQFMPYTGRHYGLEINWWIDERRDLDKSTRAAAAYLKNLYALFDDWYLAAAAYNAGEGKLGRAIKRYNTNDFWNLSQKSYLKQETRNYVPRFLAILTIARNPEQYGFEDIEYEAPLDYEVVNVQYAMDLAVVADGCGKDLKYLKKLNPQLTRGCTPPARPGGYSLKVPKGEGERFLAFCTKLKPSQRLTFVRHKIKSGETLSHIASRYNVSIHSIMDSNNLSSRHKIRAGKYVVVPVPVQYMARGGVTEGRQARSSRSAPKPPTHVPGARKVSYKVQGGDSLWTIAHSHGVSVSQLQAWNGLGRTSTIRPGQSLILWQETSGSRRSWATHVVRSGDSLWTIGQRYGVSTGDLQAWNGLGASSVLRPGQRLQVRTWSNTRPSASGAATHTVGPGDSLWSIGQQYGVSISDLREWNDLQASSVLQPGQNLALGERKVLEQKAEAVHVVDKGDSLWSIADEHGVSVASLKSWNGLSGSAKIYPGQTIRLRTTSVEKPQLAMSPTLRPAAKPAPTREETWYTVRRGDSLWSIANQHGVSVASLKSWNGLSGSARIYPGQKIRLHTTSVEKPQLAMSSTLGPDSNSARVHDQTWYTVRQGDSLWSIAQSHGVSVSELCRSNKISKRKTIHPGLRLRIPQQARSASDTGKMFADSRREPATH